MAKKLSKAEATLAVKQFITDVLVELGSEDDVPTQDEKEASREIMEVIWESLSLRVTDVSDVTGLIILGIPTNIFDEETA
jgi:hypothetical protein